MQIHRRTRRCCSWSWQHLHHKWLPVSPYGETQTMSALLLNSLILELKLQIYQSFCRLFWSCWFRVRVLWRPGFLLLYHPAPALTRRWQLREDWWSLTTCVRSRDGRCSSRNCGEPCTHPGGDATRPCYTSSIQEVQQVCEILVLLTDLFKCIYIHSDFTKERLV